MKTLISYASDNMTISQEYLVVSAYKYSIDQVLSFGRKDIDENFYLTNKETLDAERGAGYWLWKPYIINKTIHRLRDGDILIYSDAGIKIVSDPDAIIQKMDEDIFFFTNGFKQIEWCKADCMKAINYWVRLDDFTQPQVQASVVLFKVNQKTKDFVKEWLLYCQMPGFIDDSPSKITNYKTFAEHRHDQAILTCLQIKYGYKLHWWPTRYSEHLPRTDSYPAMFDHHRLRNHEYNGVAV